MMDFNMEIPYLCHMAKFYKSSYMLTEDVDLLLESFHHFYFIFS